MKQSSTAARADALKTNVLSIQAKFALWFQVYFCRMKSYSRQLNLKNNILGKKDHHYYFIIRYNIQHLPYLFIENRQLRHTTLDRNMNFCFRFCFQFGPVQLNSGWC